MRIRLVNKDGVLSSFRDVANSSLNDDVVFTFVFAFPFFNCYEKMQECEEVAIASPCLCIGNAVAVARRRRKRRR